MFLLFIRNNIRIFILFIVYSCFLIKTYELLLYLYIGRLFDINISLFGSLLHF